MIAKALICLAAGAATVLAFAPFEYNFVAILTLAALLYCFETSDPIEALICGCLFGLGLFGVGASWIYVSVHQYGHIHPVLAVPITFLFTFLLSTFISVQGYIHARCKHHTSVYRYFFLFPTLWIALELARGWFFSGFPWFYLGVSQVGSPLGEWLPIIGTHGVSYLVCLLAGVIVCLLLHPSPKRWFATLAFPMLALACFGLTQLTWTHSTDTHLKVSLLQGNIEQDIKWDPDQLVKTLKIYDEMIKASLEQDVVILPESAITLPPQYLAGYIENLANTATTSKTTLMIGIPLLGEDHTKVYNGLLVKGHQQRAHNFYYKRHLVMMGEYIPLKPIIGWILDKLGIPLSSLSAGERVQPNLSVHGVPVAPLICVETAYPDYLTSHLPEAELIVSVTDDSWFGYSLAAAQHLQIGQALAKQVGRQVLQASNTGQTALIEHDGSLLAGLKPHEHKILTVTASGREGTTPWLVLEKYHILSILWSALFILLTFIL